MPEKQSAPLHTADRNDRFGRLARNAVFSSGSWVVNVVVLMIATPYIVAKLTSEGYGIYSLLTGLVGYYGLLDFGLGQGVTKYVAQFNASNDRQGMYQSIGAAVSFQAIAGAAGSLLVVLFADPILGLLKIPEALMEASRLGLYMSVAGFFFTMIAGTFSSALMGLQLYGVIAKVNVVMNILLTLSLVIALALGNGLTTVILLTSVSAVALFLTHGVILNAHLPGFWRNLSFDRLRFKTLASFSGYLFLAKLSNVFTQYVARFVVGFYLGPAAVTYYVIPLKLVTTFGGLLSTAFSVLFPFASELSALRDRAKIAAVCVEASRYLAAFSIPVYLVVAVFSRPLLGVWMGEEFARESWVILSFLSLGSLIASLTSVPNLITMGLGYTRIIGFFSLGAIACYVALLPPLTGLMGIAGTGAAILVSTAPGIALVRYECKRIFNIRFSGYVRETMGAHWIPVLLISLLFLLPVVRSGGSSLLLLGIALLIGGGYIGYLVIVNQIPLARVRSGLSRDA